MFWMFGMFGMFGKFWMFGMFWMFGIFWMFGMFGIRRTLKTFSARADDLSARAGDLLCADLAMRARMGHHNSNLLGEDFDQARLRPYTALSSTEWGIVLSFCFQSVRHCTDRRSGTGRG